MYLNLHNTIKGAAIAMAMQAIIICPAEAQRKTATVKLEPKTVYQHIDGFGGTGMNGQWADKYTQDKVNKLWGTGENQMNMNIMRIRINPSESNWGEYGNPVKWLRKANPNATVFATPWTPPKKYKTQNTTKYQNEFGTWVWPLYEHSWGGQGSNGGAMNDDYIDDYADFLDRYRQTMIKKGCAIDMISIQNECDYTPTDGEGDDEHASYESCIFSPKQMAAMVKALKAKVPADFKVMGPECFGWGQHNYNTTLANLPDAVNNIDVWGNHIYGTNSWDYINTVTKKTGKPMWMTEFLIDNKTGNWSEEYGMISSIEKALSSGFSAYVYYNMLNDFFHDGLSENKNEAYSDLYKRAYVFGHYARFATGKWRIKTTITDKNSTPITGSAYKSADGDTISLFLLNKSTYEYIVPVILPDTAWQVTQAVTGESVSRRISDVTDKYAGVKLPKLTLLPGMFYTFEFIFKEPGESPAKQKTAYKSATNANPLIQNMFCADPTAVEYNGRLYVYGTNDQQQFDYSDGLVANDYGKIQSLVMMSTEDLVNWTYHGTIDVKAIAPWITTSWAPSIVSREEADGKTHFYMYFTNSAAGIGVLTSTSPTGPWTDPLGKALIDSKTTGLGTISNLIDPGVVIDDNGTGWLAFGGGSPNSKGTTALPGNARIVKLGDDMISLASDIKEIPAPYHFEANELNVMGGKLVFSYCTSWSATNAACMEYMVTSDPLNGTWKDKGIFFKNPGSYGFPYGNNHTHLQKFGNYWYIIYHTQWLENQMGLSGGYRNMAMNRVTLVENTQKFATITANTTGCNQLTAARVNPFMEHEAEMMATSGYKLSITADSEGAGNCLVEPKTGDWTMVRGVTFGADGADELCVTLQGKGTLDVYVDDMDGSPVGTLEFDNSDMTTSTLKLNSSITDFRNIYFCFRQAKDVKWDKWQFVNSTGLTPNFMILTPDYNGVIYNLAGQAVGNDYKGIVIKNGKKMLRK